MVRVFIHYKVVHCHDDDNDNGTTNENLQREKKKEIQSFHNLPIIEAYMQ
jgi:hypothetical protein